MNGGLLNCSTLTERLHQPFLRLTGSGPLALAAQAPLLAYARLDDEESAPTMQRVLSSSFRTNLLRQVRSKGYARHRPQDADRTRSPQWHDFSERAGRLSDESAPTTRPASAGRLLHLCLCLGFHVFVARTLASVDRELAADQAIAELIYLRAFAVSMLRADGYRGQLPDDSADRIAIMANTPPCSRIRFYAASALLVQNAKTNPDLSRIDELRAIMEQYGRAGRPETQRTALDRSRHYRAVSYVPFLRGDRAAVAHELGTAERLARAALADAPTAQDRLVALDNLHAVLETRMREALRFGDLDAALDRIGEVVRFDHFDSKAHIEMGEVLLRRGDPTAAAVSFSKASRYGPPGTQVAHFLAGDCYERLGDDERALDEYLSAIRIDPFGVSAVRGVARVARRLGLTGVGDWAEGRLGELGPS